MKLIDFLSRFPINLNTHRKIDFFFFFQSWTLIKNFGKFFLFFSLFSRNPSCRTNPERNKNHGSMKKVGLTTQLHAKLKEVDAALIKSNELNIFIGLLRNVPHHIRLYSSFLVICFAPIRTKSKPNFVSITCYVYKRNAFDLVFEAPFFYIYFVICILTFTFGVVPFLRQSQMLN